MYEPPNSSERPCGWPFFHRVVPCCSEPGELADVEPLRGAVSDRLSVPADDLFRLISTVDLLPEWNDHIYRVVTAPTDPIRQGDEWVVAMGVMGKRWNSRSRVESIDRGERRLTVISQTDDGNPSHARWVWEVVPADGEAQITVSWELYPKTFWRKVLFSKMRHRQLKEEVRASLKTAERVAIARRGSSRSGW